MQSRRLQELQVPKLKTKIESQAKLWCSGAKLLQLPLSRHLEIVGVLLLALAFLRRAILFCRLSQPRQLQGQRGHSEQQRHKTQKLRIVSFSALILKSKKSWQPIEIVEFEDAS